MTNKLFFKTISALFIIISFVFYVFGSINLGGLVSYIGVGIIFFTLSSKKVAISKDGFKQFQDRRSIYLGTLGLMMLLLGQVFK